jgi:hypothetical protein
LYNDHVRRDGQLKNNAKKAISPPRNWYAVAAWQRSGAGHHGDKKKQTSKKACRKWKWRNDASY